MKLVGTKDKGYKLVSSFEKPAEPVKAKEQKDAPESKPVKTGK